jgi:hypothetical protein
MSCCGSQRMTLRSDIAGRPQPFLKTPELATVDKPVSQNQVSLQYVGVTGLTVVGAATGTRYRFASPGAIVAVDLRDAPSLRPLPHLRRVYLP